MVSVTDEQGITSDRPFPVFAVVPPNGGVLNLGQIQSATPGVGYTFRAHSTWVLGDFNSEQSSDALYRLPYPDGMAFRIGQAPGGPITTHNSEDSQFAVDIPLPERTPIVATRDGIVIETEANETYGAQVPDMLTKANEVRIQHLDGTIAVYAHLAHGGVYVYPGQRVTAGQQIGLSGSTGYSSGPHLHFAVQVVRKTDSGFEIISLPFRFFVGGPAVAFSPQYGMLAKADYSSPGVVPSQEDSTRLVLGQQTVTSVVAETRHSQFSWTLKDIPMGVWLVFALSVWWLYIRLENKRALQRKRDLERLREMTYYNPIKGVWDRSE